MQEYDVPGLAVALYFNKTGKFVSLGVANKDTGKAVDQDTIFDLASVTKVFTSTAIALDVIKGKMKLTDSMTLYLPRKEEYQDITNVTIKSLLTHTSSLPRSPPMLRIGLHHNFESILQYLKKWKSPYSPETEYLYSNLGYGILGFALASAEKRPYRDAIKMLILNPLRMNSTFFQVPAALERNYAQGYMPNNETVPRRVLSALPASGALRSTAADMLKFLTANLGLTGPKDLREAMQLAHREFFVVNPIFSLGLGWQRVKRRNQLIIDKNGGLPGFSSYIGMIPYQKIGIVLLANKSKVPLTQIGREILIELALKK